MSYAQEELRNMANAKDSNEWMHALSLCLGELYSENTAIFEQVKDGIEKVMGIRRNAEVIPFGGIAA